MFQWSVVSVLRTSALRFASARCLVLFDGTGCLKSARIVESMLARCWCQVATCCTILRSFVSSWDVLTRFSRRGTLYLCDPLLPTLTTQLQRSDRGGGRSARRPACSSHPDDTALSNRQLNCDKCLL
ncbi:hypothetical protein TNCV_534491 [Trichonephila clavipes]|nr:hypothetical protein TNCV_534491 [Trichonephila clavipes]